MADKYLLISDGVVTNVALFDSDPSGDWILDEWSAGNNWIYDSDEGTCTAPESTSTVGTNETEYNWAATELSNADIGLNKVLDGSDTDTTETQWRGYRRALRDYATVDGDGVYSTSDLTDTTYIINDIEYAVTVDNDTGRPVSPSYA